MYAPSIPDFTLFTLNQAMLKKRPLLYRLALLPCVLLLPVSVAWAQNALPAKVSEMLQQNEIPSSALSLTVIATDSTTPLLQQQAEQPVNPASTMKLVTTLVALEELGPQFRWKTRLMSEATSTREVLKGNLYLKGGGDPNLTWDKFALMLRTLRQQGIRKIQGNLVLDRSYFNPVRIDLDAAPFDEHPDAYYNVIPDALLVHSNLSSVQITSDSKKIQASLLMPLDKVSVETHLHFNQKSCADWEKEWQPPQAITQPRDVLELRLSGGFPKNCQITNHLNLLDRNQYIARLFRQLWQEMGGSWQGQVVDGTTPDSAKLLVERQSDTLAETVRVVNKFSDNMMARSLLLTLGAEQATAGNSLDQGKQRIRDWLHKKQIADSALVVENGSGLSRNERLSSQLLAQVLQAGWRSSWNAEYQSSLPIVALDGTMRRRLKGSAADSRARIKTGTLKDSVAVAGYVRDIRDQTWIVVAIVNHDAASRAKPALDALIDWVAAGRPNL